MSVRHWSEVKPIAKAERAALAEALVSAPIEDVVRLQAQVQMIDRFITWFEAGAPANKLIGDAAPLSDY